MDIIIHISDEKTFTYEKIKKFYDTFNEAWVGKDKYKEMVYEPYGSSQDAIWDYLREKDKYHSPRTMFFVYNGKGAELKNNKEFLNSLEFYVSVMPDSRDIIPVDLDDINITLTHFFNLVHEVTNDFSKTRTLQNIQKLDNLEDTKKNTNKEQQENAKMSSKQIGLICGLVGAGAISAVTAGILIKNKLSAKPKTTKPESKNKEITKPDNNKLLT